ncbi:MAG: hypothetical protein KAS13_04490 [Candidatus Omnitrophica bacterium]|nr:hypothetical protein [Candidatus Omnitrophota bacterium]
MAELILKKSIDKICFYGKLLSNSEVIKAMMPGKKSFRVFLFSNGWKKRAKKLSRNNSVLFFGGFLFLDQICLEKLRKRKRKVCM